MPTTRNGLSPCDWFASHGRGPFGLSDGGEQHGGDAGAGGGGYDCAIGNAGRELH